MADISGDQAEIIKELQSRPISPSITKLVRAIIRSSIDGTSPRPDEWTTRDEANALTAAAFRNSYLEDLHAGRYSGLVEDSTLSRITDSEMKKLMIESSATLAALLKLKRENPEEYAAFTKWYRDAYCSEWKR